MHDLWDEVRDLNTGYNNLELDLATGKRGGRKGLIAPLLRCLTQAEDSLVVNNNAASLFLLLQEVAKGREVIVSRGEQIQIGGGFRIPDILALSGAKLVEVGTTNITTAKDYLDAITDQTALVLMVHRSNFAIRGFTESPDINEVARALPEQVVLAVDQGSGLTTEEFAPDETSVRQYIKAGADLVCYSGDKLLGGPQSGIISGRSDLIKRLEKHPMMRTFRPSRIVYSLLERLLIHKLNKSPNRRGYRPAHLEQPGRHAGESLPADGRPARLALCRSPPSWWWAAAPCRTSSIRRLRWSAPTRARPSSCSMICANCRCRSSPPCASRRCCSIWRPCCQRRWIC